MKKYYFLSLFLHLVLVIFIALSGGNGSGTGNGTEANDQKESAGNQGDNKKIIPKNIEVTIVTQPKKGASVKKQNNSKKSAGVKDCKGKAWYGGIGVEHNYSDSSITRVVPGYPAYNAGIKVGDVFVNLDTTTIIGEVGTNIHFTMKRTDGSYKMYNLVREKICIN